RGIKRFGRPACPSSSVDHLRYKGVEAAGDNRVHARPDAMKAIVQDRYGSPDVLELREIDRPVNGDDQVRVRVHMAGVDQGVEHEVAGLPYLFRIAGIGVRAPKNPIPGHDVAGTVEAVGEKVTGLRPGDEVFGTCRGAFAEY